MASSSSFSTCGGCSGFLSTLLLTLQFSLSLEDDGFLAKLGCFGCLLLSPGFGGFFNILVS